MEQLKDREDPAHAEHRIVVNPDQCGGALHQLNRRPILPAARVLVLPGAPAPSPYVPTAIVPHTGPVIGIDFGQKFQAVATNLHQQAQLRQHHKDRRRQAITRVRGRQYRELDKSAWFERKDASRRSLETQQLIDNLRGRAAALWGAGLSQVTNYRSIAYAQLDQIRFHFYSPFHYPSCGISRYPQVTTVLRKAVKGYNQILFEGYHFFSMFALAEMTSSPQKRLPFDSTADLEALITKCYQAVSTAGSSSPDVETAMFQDERLRNFFTQYSTIRPTDLPSVHR
ncbi:hypothetical protein DFS34DRAFT_673660 [Phlyctochytrium arcticum]|nr:hypothetical protein DFS34DRAFT_673660 [Phlyctochytrium arcticum]